MMIRSSNAYSLLIIAAIVLPLIAFYLNRNVSTDIMFYDNYIAFGKSSFLLLSSCLLLLIWMLHWPVRRRLKLAALSWLHVLLTIVAVALFLYSPKLLSTIASRSVASNLDSGAALTGNLSLYDLLLNTAFLLLAVGQVCFLLNVLIGFVRNRTMHGKFQ